MAKKATPAALQTDVATNEDFDKILEREGLVGKLFSTSLNYSI